MITLHIWTWPITNGITNYLTTRPTKPARWDVSLQPYLKYLSVALYINYLPLWNTQKVQEEGLKWKCWLVLVSNILKKKNKILSLLSHKVCIITTFLNVISISYVVYRPAIYRLRARRDDHSWPQRDFGCISSQTAGTVISNLTKCRRFADVMPHPGTDSSWTPNVEIRHWQHLHSFISPPTCSSYR